MACARDGSRKSTRWRSSLGSREWGSPAAEGRPTCGTRSAAHCPQLWRGVPGPRRAWFSAYSWDVLLHHFLRATEEHLGRCHRDGGPLPLWPGTESSLPATPRCVAAPAFVLHGTTTRVSTRLTVRVDLDPKWTRWCWCVEGEDEGERKGGSLSLEVLGALPAASSSPFLGLLSVLSWCLFWRSPVARGALLTTITREGGVRLTKCESRHSNVWYSLSFWLRVHFVHAHLTLMNHILAQKILKMPSLTYTSRRLGTIPGRHKKNQKQNPPETLDCGSLALVVHVFDSPLTFAALRPTRHLFRHLTLFADCPSGTCTGVTGAA